MNKTIKRIVALGAGALMLGATAFASMAYDLSNYPSPFVTNGVFQGKIVIGSQGVNPSGIASDMLGAVDIAASLQRASSTTVSTSGSTSTSTSADGYKFSEAHKLVLGDSLNAVTPRVDNIDMPVLMQSGTIEADTGSTYDYDVEVDFPAGNDTSVDANVNDNSLDSKYTAPIVYYNLGTGTDLVFYNTVIDFKDQWSAADLVAGESIQLFGRAFTFDQSNANDKDTLTLYGTDSTVLVAKGETKTITYNGQQYTIDVLGGNSDQSQAILRIGSDTRTVTKGNSKTVGGLPIYVKDVFVSNIGTQDVSVNLFVGSNKLELSYATTGGEVKLNGKTLDEVTVAVDKSGVDNWDKINKLTFTVTPKDATNEVDAIEPGGDYTDPLFGAFKFHFVGASDLTAGKELTRFEQSGKRLNLIFTPNGASSATTWPIFEGANNAGDFYKDTFHAATLTALTKDDTFVYNEYPTDAKKAVTHLLQVLRVKHGNDTSDTNFEVSVKDLSFDRTYTVTKCKALDSRVALYPQNVAADDGTTTFTDNGANNCVSGGNVPAYLPEVYTNNGLHLTFLVNATDAEIANAVALNATAGFINVTEDERLDADSSTATSFKVKYTYDTTNDAYSLQLSNAGSAQPSIGNDDKRDFWLSQFGTYIVADKDTSPYKYVNLYKPKLEVTYDMFLLPVNSEVTVTSTSTGGAVAINPIAVGAAILDSDATDLGNKPYIVVGGPCVNSAAMILMGNPTDCAAGFVEGKAKIKLFADKNALLVAGYASQDTQGAARVLANYGDYAFTGSELEVVTTNLNSLTVNKVG